MASIVGLFDTADLIVDERPRNYRAGILLNYPNGDTPLAALSALLRSESTDDPEFKWFEKPMNANRGQLGADIDDGTAGGGAQTLTVVAGTYTGALQFKAGDLLYVEHTGELMRVSSNPTADNALPVTREWAGTTGVAVTVATNNPYITKVGSSYEEGALPPQAKSFPPSVRFQCTQIFRDAVAITRTASKTRSRSGDKEAENKREGLELHMNAIERALYFGAYDVSQVGPDGHPMRSTDGLKNVLANYAPSNIADWQNFGGGGKTISELELLMYRIFERGSDEKMCFCGNRFMLTIQQIIRTGAGGDAYQLMTDQTDFGWRIRRLISPFGELVLKRHPLFNEMKDASDLSYTGMSSSGVVFDLPKLRWRHLPGDDTHFVKDVTEPGRDGKKSEWLTEAGMEIQHADHHFWIDKMHA